VNYIDEAREELLKHVKIGKGLQNVYALLVLVKGEETTLKDVHDAWSVNINQTWDKEQFGEHYSLVPFDQLKQETQEKDNKFVEAIHAAARALKEK
jgi:mannitol-1-phosphate/altronate dehydrogenase